MRPRRVQNPTRASLFIDTNDIIELDRIRATRGVSRNSVLRHAIKLFIAAQQNAA